MSSRIALIVAVALALLVTACGGGNGGGGVPQVTVPPGTVGSQHVLGSPEAPLELVEYADFQ
ncbi:MAG TPA: hypothetical protein VJ253_10345 [Dehalococcoidia bacterium]|nr:hypothetical protein [Dehalococcoidia bacterium]